MLPLKTRSRCISFRLAEDEYQQIKQDCLKKGRRSVSAYAREVLLESDGESGTTVNFGLDLATVGKRLRRLDVALTELSDVIRQTIGPSEHPVERAELYLRRKRSSSL